jgi:cytochrome c biogenesis protein
VVATGTISLHPVRDSVFTVLSRLDPLPRLVHLLSSTRFALVLILLIASLVLAGTIIDQAPASAVADQASYTRWLEQAQGKYGSWTGLLDRLHLFNVFRSLLFRSLLGLLSASVVVCTARRWRGIWNQSFHSQVRVNETFLLHTRFHVQLASVATPAESADSVRKALSRAGYRVHTEVKGDSVAMRADKHSLSRFGTFFSHLGLVLVLAGAVAGGLWGFKDPRFVVAEGATRELGLGTGISVRLDRADDEYYANGQPKQLRSDLTLFKGGTAVRQATLDVNSPLRYKGIAFHESAYGLAAVVRVEDSSGHVLFNQGVPLDLRAADGQRPVGMFEVPGEGLSVQITAPIMGAPDSFIRPGEVRVDFYQDYVRVDRPRNLSQGVPMQVANLTFTFEREGRFATLNVVKDPGTTLIWIAGGLMVFGIVLLFYLPPRRLWALATARPDGTTEVIVGMAAQRDVSLAGEFKKVEERVRRALDAGAGDSRNHGGNDG